VAEAVVRLRVDASGATRALNGVQNQTNKLQKSFGGLRTAIAGIGIGLLAKQTVSATANFKALQIRMKVITSEFGEFAQVQQLVAKAQSQFNLSIVEATQGITDIFARLRPLNVSLKDIEKTFFGFNAIAKVAGLNAMEASAAFTQLAQALGSGRLQGDEFRSISEQVPQLLKAVADETGIATGKLKDFASKGLLTSDILIRALSKSADGLGKKIEDIIDESPAEKFKKLNNELLELQLTLGAKLTPVLANAAVAAASLVDAFTKFIDSDAGQAALIITGTVMAVKALTVILPLAATGLGTFIGSLQAAAVASQLSTFALNGTANAAMFTSAKVGVLTLSMQALKMAFAKTGIGLAVIALGAFVTKIVEAVNKQREFNELLEKGSAADLAEELDKAQEKANELADALERVGTNRNEAGTAARLARELEKANEEIAKLEKALAKAKGKETTAEFEKQLDILKSQNKQFTESVKRGRSMTEEEKKQKDIKEELAKIDEKFSGEESERLKSLILQNAELKKQEDRIKKNEEAAAKLKEKFMQIGQDIEQGIVDNLTDAVMGIQSLADAAINVLNKLKRKLVEVAIEKAAADLGDKIGGFLGNLFKKKREKGGPVFAGQTYLVGEKGPELFVPKTAGTIIPNNQTEKIINNETEKIINNETEKIINYQISNTRIISALNESNATAPKTKGSEEFIVNALGGMLRENGGPVKAGQPYIVGERQPELFVPRTSGTILPSVPTNGVNTTNNITVNVDASGTSVEGDGSGADQLGQLIGNIVQQTLITEQRSGGLLNR